MFLQKELKIDRNIKNLSYNYVEKITSNYGNHHLKNVSSIIYSLGIKKFKKKLIIFLNIIIFQMIHFIR